MILQLFWSYILFYFSKKVIFILKNTSVNVLRFATEKSFLKFSFESVLKIRFLYPNMNQSTEPLYSVLYGTRNSKKLAHFWTCYTYICVLYANRSMGTFILYNKIITGCESAHKRLERFQHSFYGNFPLVQVRFEASGWRNENPNSPHIFLKIKLMGQKLPQPICVNLKEAKGTS